MNRWTTLDVESKITREHRPSAWYPSAEHIFLSEAEPERFREVHIDNDTISWMEVINQDISIQIC